MLGASWGTIQHQACRWTRCCSIVAGGQAPESYVLIYTCSRRRNLWSRCLRVMRTVRKEFRQGFACPNSHDVSNNYQTCQTIALREEDIESKTVYIFSRQVTPFTASSGDFARARAAEQIRPSSLIAHSPRAMHMAILVVLRSHKHH